MDRGVHSGSFYVLLFCLVFHGLQFMERKSLMPQHTIISNLIQSKVQRWVFSRKNMTGLQRALASTLYTFGWNAKCQSALIT